MKKIVLKLAIIVLLFSGIFSCTEKEVFKNLKIGMYSETYPYQERTKINFNNNETVEIVRDGYSEKFFKYEICDNIIKLISTSGVSSEYHFRVIDDSKFELGDIYPNTTVGTPVVMMFEKTTANISEPETTTEQDTTGGQNAVGYIVGYYCNAFYETSYTTGKAAQYHIITENLQDTLRAYNLDCELPLGFFTKPSDYRFTHKIKFNYRLATQVEKEKQEYDFPCSVDGFHYITFRRAKHIIINSFNFE